MWKNPRQGPGTIRPLAMRSLVVCLCFAAAVFVLLLLCDAAWVAMCGAGAAASACALALAGPAVCGAGAAGTWALRAAAATWLVTCASLAAAAAHWATDAALSSPAPLRDDVLAAVVQAFGDSGADAAHAMHGVVVVGASAFAAAGGPGIERALARWACAYGAALLLRAASVRATLLPDPCGGPTAGSPPPDKSALARALTHPAATRNDMLPSGHMLLVGVTAVLAPAARAQPALASAWVALAAALTLRARVHYTVDCLLGLALGALLGVAMREVDLPCQA